MRRQTDRCTKAYDDARGVAEVLSFEIDERRGFR